jgi:aspartyl-tRNA(Asn)/glutamyl-tRNA(Gln) amidotransferase subunit B
VIGLEIHVQLSTRTKMFCGCVYAYGAAPNSRVCPVCLGLPGALPVPNEGAVDLAVRAAVALGCEVSETSLFARKNYLYPDLPKGYQITQYDRPLGVGGLFSFADGPRSTEGAGSAGSGQWESDSLREVVLRRVHLEEDTGRSVHDRLPGRTALDFNRAGVPLIEIVTTPSIRSPEEARAFLVALKRTLEYLDVSDCDMEKGSLRVDANLSVRPGDREPAATGEVGDAGRQTLDPDREPPAAREVPGEDEGLGVKTEVKNLNSFSAVERALAHEAERQAGVLEEGGVVAQETRLWDADAGVTRPMRSKEKTHDYRYFPEPDLPPLVVPAARVAAIRDAMPELPGAREQRFREEYGLPAYDAGVLVASRPLADYFEATARTAGDPKAASNRIMTDVLAWLNERGLGIDAFPISPEELAELIGLVAGGTLSSTAASTVLGRMAESGRPAAELVEAEGLAQVSDDDALARWVHQALAAHPDEAARLEAGEAQLVGFFMGEVMQASGGAADPRRAADMLRDRIR